MTGPAIAVLSSLFPSAGRPQAGLFIRERMFRVAERLPLSVIAPEPWFPGQALLRRWRPGYRLGGLPRERMAGIEVQRPRFLALPGLGRRWDGLAMALAAWPALRALRDAGRCDVIDAHFAYPEGYAASLLGRWLDLPVTITLRGTEPRHLAQARTRRQVLSALRAAQRIFSVSESLRQLALGAGIDGAEIQVVGNAVDSGKFQPVPRAEARRQLGLPADAPVLVTVGALVERKGFHRVIGLLPELAAEFPGLVYLVVGGASPEGDCSARLREQVRRLGVGPQVRFLGPLAPEALRVPLSAADLFVLATSNEGWANVILEAMACGTPVLSSDVGGNGEVVRDARVGAVYPFAADGALLASLRRALHQAWDRAAIVAYAREHTWERRVAVLVTAFEDIVADRARTPAASRAGR